jgi:heterotetrameric sarcosine oxidase delta subunit
MLLLPCPWCGERPEGEFLCLGEAVPARPRDPETMSDGEWTAWLCLRDNARGIHQERWWHAKGCNSVFTVARDTVTHDIHLDAGP